MDGMYEHDEFACGADRAAALLFSISRPLAIKLVNKLDPVDIQDLVDRASKITRLTHNQLFSIEQAFTATLTDASYIELTHDDILSFVKDALPENEANVTIARISQPEQDTIWGQLQTLSPQLLVDILVNEHPQTVAHVLMQLAPRFSADIIVLFPTELQTEVTLQIATMRQPSDMVTKAIRDFFSSQFLKLKGNDDNRNIVRTTSVLNELPKSVANHLIQSIEEKNPEMGKNIRSGLFCFDDLSIVPDQAMRVIFDAVPPEQIVIALQKADQQIIQHVLNALGTRARRMVEAELAGDTSVQIDEIEAARRSIATKALELSRSGRLTLFNADVHA